MNEAVPLIKKNIFQGSRNTHKTPVYALSTEEMKAELARRGFVVSPALPWQTNDLSVIDRRLNDASSATLQRIFKPVERLSTFTDLRKHDIVTTEGNAQQYLHVDYVDYESGHAYFSPVTKAGKRDMRWRGGWNGLNISGLLFKIVRRNSPVVL